VKPGGYGDQSEWLGAMRELLRRRAMDKVQEADAALYQGLVVGHWDGPLMDACRAAREALKPAFDEADQIVDSWLDEARAGVGTEVSDPGWKMLKARIRAALAAQRE
jgi:hypothetical protein